MAWRHYRLLGHGAVFEVPPSVGLVGIAAFGAGGRCVPDQGGLGGGGGGGMAYGLMRVAPGERLAGFEVDGRSSRFKVLTAEAGGHSVDARGGHGGGSQALIDPDDPGARRWLAVAVATGGHGGVGQRSGRWVSYGGGGGLGSFYGDGGNGGDGRLVGVASMFGHGGGGGLGGDGGASLAPRAMEFIDRKAIEQAGDPGSWQDDERSSGPGGGGGGGLAAGGAAWAADGYLAPKRRAESLGGPGGGGGSFGPGETGGVLYRPVSEGDQGGRLLATETPGAGGVGQRALGGEARFHPGDYLSADGRQEDKPARDSTAETPTVYFTTGSGEGRTVMAPFLALAARELDGGGGAGANLSGAGHGGPGAGGGGAGRLAGFDDRQGQGGLAGHGGFGGGGGGGSTLYFSPSEPGRRIEVLPAGDGGVGGGGGGGGYRDAAGRKVLVGAGHGGPGAGGGGGPGSQGGQGFFVVYW